MARINSKKSILVRMIGKRMTTNKTYDVRWGTQVTYSKNKRSFKTRSAAINFKNGLIKKFKNKGHWVDYRYIS